MANPVELNRYAYVANNPINAADPSGYAAEYSLNFQPDVRATPALAALGLATGKALLAVRSGYILPLRPAPAVIRASMRG